MNKRSVDSSKNGNQTNSMSLKKKYIRFCTEASSNIIWSNSVKNDMDF